MKAVRIHFSGDASHVRMEDVQPPSMMEDDHVLVRIRDAGVNQFDFSPAAPTRTLGMDFSGQVVETGVRARNFARGDRVFGFANGSYAEFAAIPARAMARMPRSTDFVAAAALPTPGLTAYQIMMHEVQLDEDQSVLIHGAASIVGALAVQLGVWKRARIIAVASAEDAPYLASLGVHQVLDYRKKKFDAQVGEVDAVVDLVGGDALARSYGIVRQGGVIVTTAGRLDQAVLDRNGIRGEQFELQPNGTQLRVVARLVDEGILVPRLSRVLPLADAPLAQELMQARGAQGKIVLSVSHP
jgi:NADPH:quinone reductase-like Zn-dependent oxidoreductase